VIDMQLSKVANVNLPHLHLAPPLGVTQVSCAKIFGITKLASLGYHVALFLSTLAISVQHGLVTDGQTDTRLWNIPR